jgi:hypothetical protein
MRTLTRAVLTLSVILLVASAPVFTDSDVFELADWYDVFLKEDANMTLPEHFIWADNLHITHCRNKMNDIVGLNGAEPELLPGQNAYRIKTCDDAMELIRQHPDVRRPKSRI